MQAVLSRPGLDDLTRRRAIGLAAVLAGASAGGSGVRQLNETITAVPGIRVGHWTHGSGSTGCTAVLIGGGAVAGVDVRGGAPGTRETDLLRPEASVDVVHAVMLSGGSAYGLSAAGGAMRFLERLGIGFRAGKSVVPIVPAAILFDLGVGDPAVRPDEGAGFLAAEAASDAPVAMGTVGAGAGATVGKLFGPERATRGGLGSAAVAAPDGIVIGALAAVNALGDVVDPETRRIVAGARNEAGDGFADTMAALRAGMPGGARGAAENTTLGVVAANVSWTKAGAAKVAQMAHDGLAMAIRPAHMPFDGDTVFALGTGGRSADSRLLGTVGALAAEALARAVVAGVRAAARGFGIPAASDLASR